MENKKIKVIAVLGPTASGKTSLGVYLAKRFNGEVISADSMQVYKGMDIATAKPDTDQMQGVPHHLIGYVSVCESYNVSRYVDDAKKAICETVSRGHLPIVVGGTGLYADSLLENVSFLKEGDSKEVRHSLEKRLEAEGISPLYEELLQKDPEAAKNIHINNTKRVLRALEIYYLTGLTMTEQKIKSRLTPTPYDTVYIGLKCKDRENLYERINKRVDIMLEKGLINEAKQALNSSLGKTAQAAIGHKELAPFLRGEITLDEATENLKRETRRYAKRQLTWFMKNDKINWIDIDTLDKDEIFKTAERICREGGIGV